MTAADARFSSVGALQAAHLALRTAIDAIDRPDAPTGQELRREILLLRRQVRAFERSAAATGVLLDDRTDRDLVQSLLDFWSIRQGYLQRTAARLRSSEAFRGARPRGSGTGLAVPGAFALAPFDEASAPALPEAASPFIGLNAFGEVEASRAIFQGRGEAVVELAQIVATNRLVMVAGASGSGKSSLVMAGLVPALRKGAIAGSADWHYWPVILPGADPVAALLQTVRPPARDAAGWVAEHRAALIAKPDMFLALVAPTPGDPPALLVVDQSEELVSMCSDAAARAAFTAALLRVSDIADPPHHVIVIVRDDFLSRLNAIDGFAALPETGFAIYRPKPMTSVELRLAIEEPARAAGLKFDPGIVEDLVREVVDDPAALPLLQFTLTQLWQHRTRNRITQDAYTAVGRPREALERTADRVFAGLKSQENEAAAKAIFLTLVVHSVGKEYVRRRVRRETLHQLGDSGRIDRVLTAFVAAGLIRLTPGSDTADDRFDVMHEALLRNWRELTVWLEHNRNATARQQQVLARAEAWRESGRQPDHLAIGAALAEASEFVGQSPLIGDYVMASRDAETTRGKSELSRMRVLRIAMTLAIGAALSIAVFLYFADRNRRSADEYDAETAVASNEIVATETQQAELGTELRPMASSVAATAPSAAKAPVVARAAIGPGVDGYLWVGTDRQSYIRDAASGAVAKPSAAAPDKSYRLRVNLAFRSGWPPDGSYVSPPALFRGAQGSSGALVAVQAVKGFARQSGMQYWLKVRLVPQVFIQYPRGADEQVGRVADGLRQSGYDIAPPEGLSVKPGMAEIRYYHEQDRLPAEALAQVVATLLGRTDPVRVNPMKGFAARGDPGKLELWIDPGERDATAPARPADSQRPARSSPAAAAPDRPRA